jgi:transglutaminase-like putative cysteine protease
MAIRIALHHRTEYRFDRDVRLAPHAIRLRPAPHCRTRVTGYSLTVEPAGHFLNWQQDPQGNHVARLVFPEPTRRLVLEVDLVAELVAINAFMAWYLYQTPGLITNMDDVVRYADLIFSSDEMAMLGGIIGFWFGSRNWDKKSK